MFYYLGDIIINGFVFCFPIPPLFYLFKKKKFAVGW